MKRNVLFDIESYYDDAISVREMCMRSYMAQSYVYLASVVSGPFNWVGTPKELRSSDPKASYARSLLLDPNNRRFAVNSNFDQQWCEHDSVLPESRGLGWECVSDFATYHQRPRDLARIYETVTGKTMSKGMRTSMKGVHPDLEFDFMDQGRRDYNLFDSQAAQTCLVGLEKLGSMSEMERKIAAHTRMICRRGIPCDEAFIEKCRQALSWIKFKAQKEIPWAKVDKVMSVQAFNTWCCQQGVAPPANLKKADADFTAWMSMNPTLAPVLKARQRWELSNRKVSHIEKFMARVVDGIYYPDLLYCGAPHTRRWSAKGSSDGKEDGSEEHSAFNIQNMDRLPLFGDILPDFYSPNPPLFPNGHPRAGEKMPGIFFRNFLVPPPGKKFGILDFSQIEPRCLNWLAGNEKFLDLVRQGYALYEAFARSVGMWNEPGKLKDGPVEFYTLIKNIVIGAGYGMSGRKFSKYAKIPEEQAIEEIRKFRRAAREIPNFWYSVHGSIEQAYQNAEPLEIQMPNGQTYWRFGVERYEREDPVSGERRYAYRAGKVLGAQETIGDIYGAKVVENITQRMGRDLLGEAIVRFEESGIPVLFHAHDEVIVLLDANNTATDLATAKEVMTVVPPWAAGLPIQCSGVVADSYSK